MNRIKVRTAAGLLAIVVVLGLMFVIIAPAYAVSQYRLVNVTVSMVWTSSKSQASAVTVNSATDVTISVTNEDSQSYTFTDCIITIAAPSSAKFLTGFTCGVAAPFTLAGGATTSYTGPLTIPGPPTFPDGCPGGCNLVISYTLVGQTGQPSTGYPDVESYPGYLIANLQPYAGTGF